MACAVESVALRMLRKRGYLEFDVTGIQSVASSVGVDLRPIDVRYPAETEGAYHSGHSAVSGR
jgi:hypothetical protein